jgi:hypothetical protein
MNSRSTNKPCPCGSGLTGLRNITAYSGHHIVCAKCRVPVQAKEYRVVHDPRAKASAEARRRLEVLRDEREAREGNQA